MKKTLLIAALASAALVSCSKDEVVKINQDEIKFSVVADNQTKASAVYCGNNLMNSFQVWSEYTADGSSWQTYFADETVTNTSGNWGTANTRYWPELTSNAAINFYAVAGVDDIDIMTSATDDWTGSGKAPVIKDFQVEGTVANQKDLLYSVAKYSNSNPPTNGEAAMNFRHALSQIEFQAKNTSYSLYVEISGVMVANVMGKGTFTFPKDVYGVSVSTNGNWTLHGGTDTDTEDNANTTGSWVLSTDDGDRKSYTAALTSAVPVDNDNAVVSLTLSNDKENVGNSMLLLPNETATTAWVNTDALTKKGTYLAVKCNIWNKANVSSSGKQSTDVKLHEGWAVIPVSFTWKPGKKYIYTFVFGNGNGGIDGGNSDTPTPNTDPVLVPIDYTVTVDDFDKIVVSDVTMNK